MSSQNTQKKIAILYDCPYPFVVGGGQKRLYEIATRLIRQEEFSVDWYSLQFWEGEKEIEYEGIRFFGIGKKTDLYEAKTGKRRIREALEYSIRIFPNKELFSYDIILAGQWPLLHLFPLFFYSKLGRARFFVDWWEVWQEEWIRYSGIKGVLGMILERICCRLPDEIICISETGKLQLETIGASSRKLHIIHNGIDFTKIQQSPPSNEVSDLIYLGRLQQHKNVIDLIYLIAILKKKYQMSMTLQIIGDGPERSVLENEARNLQIDSQVRFLGEIESDEEVYSRMKSAKLFVHPSTKEGGGSIVSLEANACGLPVVAYTHPHGISSELLEEGLNGYWVDGCNPESLAEKIVTIMENKDYALVSQRCIQYAKEFDWNNIIKLYKDLF